MNVVSCSLPVPNLDDIRRYAHSNKELDSLVEECLIECGSFHDRVCFQEYPLSVCGKQLNLGFCRTESADLAKALQGCSRILLFAATVGLTCDRLIAKYNRISPTKALLMQAIGTERVEALCDAFCSEQATLYRRIGYSMRPRFSPGYGDLSLSLQTNILSALDLTHQLGITLNEHLLMTPSKSVTAIIGIEENGGDVHELS